MKKGSKSWSVADAKAHLSEVIDSAASGEPQIITRKGIETVVIVSFDEWQRKTARKGSLADFFASSPLPGSNLQITRQKDKPRDIKL